MRLCTRGSNQGFSDNILFPSFPPGCVPRALGETRYNPFTATTAYLLTPLNAFHHNNVFIQILKDTANRFRRLICPQLYLEFSPLYRISCRICQSRMSLTTSVCSYVVTAKDSLYASSSLRPSAHPQPP